VIEWAIERNDRGLLNVESWDPMSEGAVLFHQFGEMVVDENGAQCFFQNFGPLFWDNEDAWTAIGQWNAHIPREEEAGVVVREPVYDWCYEAKLARMALATYTAVKNKDFETLSAEHPCFKGAPTRTDLLRDAQTTLARRVNAGMRGRVTVRLDIDQGKSLGFSLSREPINLLGAMWLMFADEVAGRVFVETCPYCGEFFVMTPKSNSKGREYCSDACRNKAWRANQSKGGETNDET
jgi:hypothetical protein